MLNEIDEVEQYIGNVDECSRLYSWFFFNKNRGGIPRALTIIARHYLFFEYNYATLSDKSQKEAAREKTKHILAAWCGFNYKKYVSESENDNDDSAMAKANIDEKVIKRDNIDNWLLRYLSAHPYSEKLTKADIENDLTSFIEDFEQKWFVESQKDIYQLVNHRLNIDALNFYSIIADAIQAGPLKQRKLQYNKEDFEKDFSNLSNKVKERVLKIIGAYLIALDDQAPNNQTVRLNNIDLANWMGYPTLGQGKNKKQLFNEKTYFIPSYSNGLYIIDKDFLIKYDFKIKTY